MSLKLQMLTSWTGCSSSMTCVMRSTSLVERKPMKHRILEPLFKLTSCNPGSFGSNFLWSCVSLWGGFTPWKQDPDRVKPYKCGILVRKKAVGGTRIHYGSPFMVLSGTMCSSCSCASTVVTMPSKWFYDFGRCLVPLRTYLFVLRCLLPACGTCGLLYIAFTVLCVAFSITLHI